MGPFEIIVVIAAVLIVVGVIGFNIYKKVTGKSMGCGCDCSGCSACSHCQSPSKKEESK